MTEQNTTVATATAQPTTTPNPTPTARPTNPAPRRRSFWMIGLALLVIAIGGGWYFYQADTAKKSKEADKDKAAAAASDQKGESGEEGASDLTMKVEVTHPKKGGLGRVSNQPADVHAFQYADLRSRVSGFMQTEAVDIGDTVKRGQVLALIYAPEKVAAKDQAEALLDQANEMAQRTREKVKTAKANVKSMKATIVEKKAMVRKFESDVKYRHSELERVKDLVAAKSLERRMQDEEQEHYDTAEAALAESKAKILTAEADYDKSLAEQAETEAEVKVADAKIKGAEADYNLAAVYVEYLKITSPYDGVITRRTFHPGDFIRADPDGTSEPILSVARTDRLRVVIRVPDMDVPFVKVGDRTIIKIDALKAFPPFEGKVSRFADSEDVLDRTMRTEVALMNYKGMLKPGMYGRGLIILTAKSEKSQTIPATAVFKQNVDGTGYVYAVKKDNTIERKTIKIGENNGIDIEVLDGLSAEDDIVANYNGSIQNGMKVESVPYVAKTTPKINSESANDFSFDEKGTTIDVAAPLVDSEKGDMTPIKQKTDQSLLNIKKSKDLKALQDAKPSKNADSSKDANSAKDLQSLQKESDKH